MLTKAYRLLALMDDCLISIEDGKPVDDTALRQLPPWRAVLIARVAVKAGAMSQEDCDALVQEAIHVTGNGSLRPHKEE